MNLLKGYHKHHIIPKHIGGTDSKENLVLISPIDHMIFHMVNYRIFGRWQDAAAAKILGWNAKMPIGFTRSEETKQKMSLSQKGKFVSEKTKQKQAKVKFGSKNPMFGKKHKLESKQKMSKNLSGKNHRLAKAIKYNGVIYYSHRSLAKFLNISQAAVSKRIQTCPQKYGYEVLK